MDIQLQYALPHSPPPPHLLAYTQMAKSTGDRDKLQEERNTTYISELLARKRVLNVCLARPSPPLTLQIESTASL